MTDKPQNDTRRERFGDARPNDEDSDPPTGGSQDQERPEDRPMVGSVKPEDYPKDRPR